MSFLEPNRNTVPTSPPPTSLLPSFRINGASQFQTLVEGGWVVLLIWRVVRCPGIARWLLLTWSFTIDGRPLAIGTHGRVGGVSCHTP